MILTLLCVLAMGTRAADYQYLVFTMADGTQQAVTASNLTITFNDGNMIASSDTETLATIALSALATMEFQNTTSGIQTISADTLITDDATVVYDMNGRMMPKEAALPKGIYILKNGNKTIKMQIK